MRDEGRIWNQRIQTRREIGAEGEMREVGIYGMKTGTWDGLWRRTGFCGPTWKGVLDTKQEEVNIRALEREV